MFRLSIWNVWVLSLPFFIIGLFFMGMKKEVAKRMSDMTGYSDRERAFTLLASVAPYPFMIVTVWTPFTTTLPLLYLGISLYVIGMVLYTASLKAIIRTSSDELFARGPYRYTRNPLYVAATIVFMGICFVTGNILLAGYLAVAVVPQHFMILAEERICKDRYGSAFEDYLKRVPRYLFMARYPTRQ